MGLGEIGRQRIREECEQKGISWARTHQPSNLPERQAVMLEWIDEQERKEAEAEAAEQKRIARESLEAARLAAETSRDSAIASRRSAFWTMWAAIAAAVSAAVPLLQAAGVLPK